MLWLSVRSNYSVHKNKYPLFYQIPFSNLLLYPPSLCMIVLVCAVVAALFQQKRTAIGLTAMGLIWVLIWSLPVTTLYLGGKLESRYPYGAPESLERADYIVVLGGNTQANRSNWFEPYNRATATDRIDRAAALYFAGRAPKILVAGGAYEGRVSEAQGMAKVLRQKGVPEQDIVQEKESRNTYENALYTERLLKSQPHSRLLLVTSALHMPRAQATFKRLDMPTIPAGVAPQIVEPDDYAFNIWLPHTRSLEASRTILKEYFGLLGYWLRGWI
jgi:uncharacterized SAM-binding protein YcdF (DUF218 family)